NCFCLPNRRDAKAKTPRMKIRGVFFYAAGSCETTTVGVTMTASDAADADLGRYASRRDQPITRSTDQPGSLHRIAGGHPSRARRPRVARLRHAKTPRHAVAFSVTASRRRPARRDQ
ncbi:hypothetical protein, partial [Burkholderia cepacia]|uniref:hypothetical protein n=1 Tax=Burkholderia cepacia TaxID=292 RepID=UPI002AB79A8D